MESRVIISTKDSKKIKREGFLKRIKNYLFVDFHPIVFFYIGGIIMLVIGGSLGLYVLYKRFTLGSASYTVGTLLLIVLFIIMGFQSFLFGKVFELESEKGNK
jgi:hypothetical protein